MQRKKKAFYTGRVPLDIYIKMKTLDGRCAVQASKANTVDRVFCALFV